jgi:hypothetical protein
VRDLHRLRWFDHREWALRRHSIHITDGEHPYGAIGGCREVNKTHHFSEIYSIFSKSRSR